MKILTSLILSGLFDFNWEDPLRPNWEQFHGSQRVAFELFGRFEVRWYAVIIMMSILLSVVVGYFGFAKRMHANSDLLSEGVVIGIVAGIVGARLWYVIMDVIGSVTSGNPSNFTSIKDIFDLSSGGLAISGAVILVAIALAIFCKWRKLRVLELLEIVLPIVLLSQVIGRWGNFFNQEATGDLIKVSGLSEALEAINNGTMTRLPDAVLTAQRQALWFLPDFVIDRMYIAEGVKIAGYYQPCFFYESLMNFIGVVLYLVLRRVIKKGIYVGDGLSFYLIWYGIVRFFIEHMRTDAQSFIMFGQETRVVVVYSSIMVLAGIAWLIIRRVKKIRLVTVYDALYGPDASMLKSEEELKNQKHKKELRNKKAVE